MTSDLMFATRRDDGQRAYLSGAVAEDGVAKNYANRGIEVRETRWRGAPPCAPAWPCRTSAVSICGVATTW